MIITTDSTLRAPPERITVRTCFGCGALGRLGGCDTECPELRLELVRAAAFDEVAGVRASADAAVEAFRQVVQDLAWSHLDGAEGEYSYRRLQDEARVVLHNFPHRPKDEDVTDTPTEATTATWCGRCGTVESFQPCMEVCIWRPVEWVRASSYRRERSGAVAAMLVEAHLRGLLQRVAWVAPLDDQWRACLRVLRAEARRVLETSSREPRALQEAGTNA